MLWQWTVIYFCMLIQLTHCIIFGTVLTEFFQTQVSTATTLQTPVVGKNSAEIYTFLSKIIGTMETTYCYCYREMVAGQWAILMWYNGVIKPLLN